MFEEPTVGKMLSDVERTIEEVKELNLTQGVRISLTSLYTNQQVVMEMGPRSVEIIMRSLESELLNVKASWEKLNQTSY